MHDKKSSLRNPLKTVAEQSQEAEHDDEVKKIKHPDHVMKALEQQKEKLRERNAKIRQ